MTNQEFKFNIMAALRARNEFTEILYNHEVRTRCPFCGDSQKNFRTGHLYLRINPNDNLPIVYNCFKCPAQGVLKYDDLELLGICGDEYKMGLTHLNKTSDRVSSQDSIIKDIAFEYENIVRLNTHKLYYIENRLGVPITPETVKGMKVVTSLYDFLQQNKIDTLMCKPGMADMLEKHYIGFLSNNNSHILFRALTDDFDIRWYKYPITHASVGQRLFYSMESTVDLYTEDEIIINLAEGVMDTISICHNLDFYQRDNVLNISVCGKHYTSILKYLFGMGFVGTNITVNIFADRDGTTDTSIEYYKKIFKDYSYFVRRINVYYNLASKDCGVPKSKIALEKHVI